MTLTAVSDNAQLVEKVKTLYDVHGLKALDVHWLRENERSLAFALAAKKISLEDISITWKIFEEWQEFIQKKLLDEWKELYRVHKTNAFRQRYLEKNKLMSVLSRGKRHGLGLREAANQLGIWEKVDRENKSKPNNGQTQWTKEIFENTVEEVINRFGTIPPYNFLIQNGFSGFTNKIAKYGPGYEKLRSRYNVNNVRLQSVDGQTWLSMNEVCVANFLSARGITVRKGKKYADEYSQKYPRSHALFDLHFIATSGLMVNLEMSVEIWGGGRSGDIKSKKKYAETRKFKEEFNSANPAFIGIEHHECYSEDKLSKIFRPYIGRPQIINHHPLLKVPTTLLSQVDLLIDECRELCDKLPKSQQTLPSADWFARRKLYKNRHVFSWEPASWGRMQHILNRIGYQNIRNSLGQTNKQHRNWDKRRCLTVLESFLNNHNMTASALARKFKNYKNKDEQQLHSDAQYLNYKWRDFFEIRQTIPNIRLMIDRYSHAGHGK